MESFKTFINALKLILKRKADVADVAEVQNAVDINTEAITELNAKVERNKPPLKITVQRIEGSFTVTYTPSFSEIVEAYNEGRELIAYMPFDDAEGGDYAHIIKCEGSDDGSQFTFVLNAGSEALYIAIAKSIAICGELYVEDWRIGELSELTTEAKTSVVSAINEVDGKSGGGEIYRIEFDQENSTITHGGEEINWVEFEQKIEAGVPIVLTGTVTPPGDVPHRFQAADYFLADVTRGVLVFSLMFWPMSGETANFAQIIVDCSNQNAFYTIGTVGYTHQYPPLD